MSKFVCPLRVPLHINIHFCLLLRHFDVDVTYRVVLPLHWTKENEELDRDVEKFLSLIVHCLILKHDIVLDMKFVFDHFLNNVHE
jgi:hypothetical protein